MSKKKGKIPPGDLIHVVYVSDPNYEDKISKIKKRIMAEYETADGLTIIRTWVPEPGPLPEKFILKESESQE